jgi:DNA-binding response OmpR family regulator
MSREQREVLVYTDCPLAREAMASAAMRASCRPIGPEDVDEAVTILLASDGMRTVVVDAASGAFVALMRTLRDQPRLYGVPVLVVVPDRATASFDEAHELGADGVIVHGHWSELTECLEVLVEGEMHTRPPIVHGTVLVAHRSVGRRRALARGLRRVGFGVAFAADVEDVEEQVEREDPCAILLGAELIDGSERSSLVKMHRYARPVVVLADAVRARSCDRAMVGLDDMVIAPASSTAPSLVFRVGELLRPQLAEARSSQRLLASTLCFFRATGTHEVRHGMTHNISAEGLYVRALAPPPRGTQLWIELEPPGRDRLIHLCCEVVWCRKPGLTGGGGPTPPGFGVRILDEACAPPDLTAYRDAYDELAARRWPEPSVNAA